MHEAVTRSEAAFRPSLHYRVYNLLSRTYKRDSVNVAKITHAAKHIRNEKECSNKQTTKRAPEEAPTDLTQEAVHLPSRSRHLPQKLSRLL